MKAFSTSRSNTVSSSLRPLWAEGEGEGEGEREGETIRFKICCLTSHNHSQKSSHEVLETCIQAF